jgi:hypothetical protein
MLALKVIVEWITPLLHIREDPGLNFGPETGLLSQVFSAFFPVPPGEFQDITYL